MLEMYRIAAQLAASQVVLSSTELVSSLLVCLVFSAIITNAAPRVAVCSSRFPYLRIPTRSENNNDMKVMTIVAVICGNNIEYNIGYNVYIGTEQVYLVLTLQSCVREVLSLILGRVPTLSDISRFSSASST
jgi:hypothetical protein